MRVFNILILLVNSAKVADFHPQISYFLQSFRTFNVEN